MSTTSRTRLFAVALLLALAHAAPRLPRSREGEKRLEGKTIVSAVSQDAQERFSTMYAEKQWGPEGNGSGVGSTPAATVLLLSILRAVVMAYNVQTLLDAPCGAMGWQPRLLEALQEDNSTFQYRGVDIVPQIIQDNQARFAQQQNWRFAVLDIAEQKLPEGQDLIFSRDALQHLPCAAGVSALRNFAFSDARYLLVGSYNSDKNLNVKAGGMYAIDVRKPPFLLTNVLRTFNEHTSRFARDISGLENEPDKLLLMYSTDYLRAQDFGAMLKNCDLLEPEA